MNEPPAAAPGAATYVVCEPARREADAIRDFLRERGGTDPIWVAPRDVSDLDAPLRASRGACVLFPTPAVFLEALWDQRIDFDAWVAAGVAIEFATGAPASPDQGLRAFVATWQTWQRRRRRRQVLAGLVFSLIAVAAACTLLLLHR